MFYADPRQAIDWLCRAFGFEVRMIVDGPDGRVEHSELEFAEGLVMVSGVDPSPAKTGQTWRQRVASPKANGGRFTQSLCLYVDDADAHCARARAAGAEIAHEPVTNDYGPDHWTDRSYAAFDLEGHMWWFMQRLRTANTQHSAR